MQSVRSLYHFIFFEVFNFLRFSIFLSFMDDRLKHHEPASNAEIDRA